MASMLTKKTASSNSPPPQDKIENGQPSTTLDLGEVPPIYVLSTHLDTDTLHGLEDDIVKFNGHLTCDVHEGRIFIGQIKQKRRAALELRSIGLPTTAVSGLQTRGASVASIDSEDEPARKVRRVGHSSSGARIENNTASDDTVSAHATGKTDLDESYTLSDDVVIVVSTSWLEACKTAGRSVSLSDYIVYKGKKNSEISPSTDGHPVESESPSLVHKSKTGTHGTSAADILARARADLDSDQQPPEKTWASKSQTANSRRRGRASGSTSTAKLTRQTTSEHDSDSTKELPELPDWAKRESTYSCERSTPENGPNEAFVAQLKKIRLARTLTLDEIGVRAYSTSIAAIAAYPYPITDSREILRLPGCDTKIGALWTEWQSTGGFLQAVHDAETDDEMKVLRLFYDIWGVGAQTARNFYNRGWRDLDDVIEYGWNELTRVQQIGVKYFEEFQLKLSRKEVEAIAATVHEHAQRVREPTGVRSIIVGGYRRGKEESGDVDIIVTHVDESQTVDIVQDIVQSLVEAGWVTHELSTSLQSSRRGQATLPFRQGGGGHGFDNLDKALVVWQEPAPEGTPDDQKNPNVHRRVDIIIARWSRIGCAVLGWSAGMTFERDIRRYVKHKFKWKFDSSGIRSRVTGEEIDLENIGSPYTSAEEAERKIFAGMGLEYKEPWERCTG